MSISHWGIFPGWYQLADLGFGEGRAVFVPVSWDQYCAAYPIILHDDRIVLFQMGEEP